ncbi:MAG: ABC transporter ATP-binding protein [Candidatus Thermoplasmatota archaeon]|nr:ABC transporter ATP-binding protein [Candidatus Thermoplasmatota archaeon]MCL5730908.1 ABC transporter ATP-binding protein [Candidatus Thermoplasmatota archaeon]
MPLSVDNVSVSRGNFRLHVDSISLSGGEMLGIIGPNGSGKSTLLRVICGLLRPDTGSVRIDGKDISTMRREAVARKVSLMVQDIPAPFALSVDDIMRTACYSNPENKNTVDEVLEMCRISQFKYRDFNTLSGGERRMVMLAATILQGSEIMLLDEPSTFLDPDRETLMFRIIDDLKQQGKSIVAVLHDISMLYRYSDSVCMMRSGGCIAFGRKDDVVTEENLEKTFGIKFMRYDSPEGRRFAYYL